MNQPPNQQPQHDSDEYSLPPQSLDAALEREAILSGLLSRSDASFPENRVRHQSPTYPKRRARDVGSGDHRYEKP